MPVIALSGGRGVLWEPTTDLLCTYCRKPVDVSTLMKPTIEAANFVFDFGTPPDDPLRRGEYWYLHKRCSRIEGGLIREGATIHWGMHPMGWVLGIDKHIMNGFGDLSKHLSKRMPPGVYDSLYSAWEPAIPVRFRKRVQRSALHSIPEAVVPMLVRPGIVYILQAAGTPRIKIGRTTMAPIRLETLQTASPYPLLTLRTIPATDGVYLETLLHRRYDRYRRHGEWFELPHALLEALLQEQFD